MDKSLNHRDRKDNQQEKIQEISCSSKNFKYTDKQFIYICMESSICSPDLQGQYVVRVDLQVELARLGVCCADGWKETLRAFEPVLLHLLLKFVVKLLIKNPGQ